MASTTVSTLAGLMDIIVSDAQAIFRTQSDLFNAVYSVESTGAYSVQFQTQAVPTAVSGITDGNQITASAISIGAQACALNTYPVLATVTNKALKGGADVAGQVANAIAGKLAGTIDSAIAALFSSFTGSVGSAGSAFSMELLLSALAKLDASKYYGTKVVVLHPAHFADVAKDLIAVSGMTRDEIISRGFLGRVFGAELYVTPWIAVDNSDDAVSGAFIKEAAVGFGYYNPLINLSTAPNLSYAAQDVLGEAYFNAVVLNAGAGVKITADAS